MNFSYSDSHISKLAQISFINVMHRVFIGHTLREPVISPFKPINRLLKTDRHKGPNQNRLNSFEHKILN